MGKEKPIVFFMKSSVCFTYFMIGMIGLGCSALVAYMNLSESPEWQKFIEDVSRETHGMGGVIVWAFFCLFLFSGYMHLIHALTYKVKVFGDRIEVRMGFKTKTMYWNEIERFHQPWWTKQEIHRLVGKQKKMYIRTGMLEKREVLISMVQANIAGSHPE